MIQPAQLHVYATTKPSRDLGKNVVCGRCGRVRGVHLKSKTAAPPPVCNSCKQVLLYDGWTLERINNHYGKAT